MSEHAYLKKEIPPPVFTEGQIVEIDYLQIKQVEGQWGPQYVFDGVVTGDQHKAKAWVKIHNPVRVNHKLGKLCLLVEQHVGRGLSGHAEAMRELQTLGSIYFNITGTRDYQGQKYPKYNVHDEKLPATQRVMEEGQISTNKAQTIVKHIAANTDFDEKQIEDMVAEELSNSGNLFSVDVAAVLVARTLEVDLETTGERVA